MTAERRRQPVRFLAGGLSVLCVALAGCGDRAVGQSEDTGSYGIAWYVGSVDSAFELARSQGTPVLLYWGADWCPPCSRLKSMVFNRREFIEQSRLFVPVSLDGDDPGAQKLGERFDVYGYPTTIVFTPEGDEITRITGGLYLDQYLKATDIALAATRPVAAAYDAAAHGRATAADYRLLAYYSWAQDRERLVPSARLPDALKSLQGSVPGELAAERALLFIHYLRAYERAASEDDAAPILPAEERPAAQERLLDILQDPALTAAVRLSVVYGAHWLLPMIAQPDDAGRAALESAWETAIARIRNAPDTSPADRVGTYYGEICLAKAREPDGALPASLVREARRAVLSAARDTDDPYARLALFNSAWTVLRQVGFDDATWDYVLDEAEHSLRPETVMRAVGSSFASAADQTSNESGMDSDDALHWSDNALYWMERAWHSATGTTTRFEGGLMLVRTMVSLTPEDSVAIEDTTIALFRELSTEQNVFFNRITRAMERLETALHEWNVQGSHSESLARIRAEVLNICATIPAGDQSRNNCEAFLASLDESSLTRT